MKSFYHSFFNKTVCTFIFLIGVIGAKGQNVHFSQFHQTPMLTNPAMVASDDAIKVDLQYRTESVGPAGQAFVTPALSIVYPLINQRTGHRWGGIGGMVIQDQAGLEGILKTSGAALAFAYNLRIKPHNFLSFGAQAGYFQRVLDETKLTTGNQWVLSTFVPTSDIGETLQNLSVSFLSAESGLFWHMEDTLRRRRAYIGFAARQLTQPNINFTESGDNKLPLTLVVNAGVRAFQNDQFSVVPNLRYLQQGNTNQINVGSAFKYHFGQEVSEEGVFTESSIGLNTWYSVNNAMIAGIEVNYKKLYFSFSYDFSLSNPQNRGLASGATEVMIGFRKDLGHKRIPKEKPIEVDSPKVDYEKPELIAISDSVTVSYEDPRTYNVTEVQFDLLQRSILFPYKHEDLTDGTKLFLDRIITLLKAHPDMKIEISGHTCEEGDFTANKVIAENRAIAVYNYFLLHGISKDRLFVRGFADKRPVADNDMEAGRIRNRRVEFRVAKPNK